MSSVEYDTTHNAYIFPCPHCDCYIQVGKDEVNCRIFRHGSFYTSDSKARIPTIQINPHLSKQECDHLAEQDLILGCGKPFQMILEGASYQVKICDYI